MLNGYRYRSQTTGKRLNMSHKTAILLLLAGLIMSGCVTTGTSNSISNTALDKGNNKKTGWSADIPDGMSLKKLLKKKGKPDVTEELADGKKVYYYWVEHGHIPVYIENDKVTWEERN